MTRLAAAVLALAVLALSVAGSRAGERVLVFAAASMRDALLTCAEEYRENGADIVFSFAASSVLAKQIAAGAPADLFISADSEWVDWLEEQGAVKGDSRRIIAANALVIARKSGAPARADAREALAGSRIAMGDPSHVPAGRYARNALEKAGIWENVRRRAVFGENVRVAAAYLRSGAVDAAIVYASDLTAFPQLGEVYRFADESHPAIVYPAVIPVAAKDDKGADFLRFLLGKDGQTILARHGFLPVAD